MTILNAVSGSLGGWRVRWAHRPLLPPLTTMLILLVAFLAVVPHFADVRTLSGILSAASVEGVMVVGMTLLMIAGEFDLSIGAIMAMASLIFSTSVLAGWPPLLAAVVAIAVAAGMGAINGMVTMWTRIPSLVVTLGTSYIYRMLVWLYAGGTMAQITERFPLVDLLNGRLDVVNQFFRLANFRTSTVWLVLVAALFQFLLTRTKFGNHVFAVGGDAAAAKARGVNVRRTKIICFTLCASMAGLAGLIDFGEFLSSYVSTGQGVEFNVAAATVVGGTLLSGGVGSMWGALVGVLLIGEMRTAAVLLGLPANNFQAIVGIAIVGAAAINARLGRRS